MTVVEALVPGGKATPSPPLGPALGPLGVNVKAIIDKINEETKDCWQSDYCTIGKYSTDEEK